MNDLALVMNAAHAAAQWHVNQRRKGRAREPYINHLLEVAQIVADVTEGADANLVAAALLHDTIEDCGVTPAVLEAQFGSDITALVLEVTDDKSLKKPDRKRMQVVNAPMKSTRAKILKLADKTSNMRAIKNSPAKTWSAERCLAYIAWGREVAAGLRGVNAALEVQFDQAASGAEQSVVKTRET
eukprot:gene12634-12726_t